MSATCADFGLGGVCRLYLKLSQNAYYSMYAPRALCMGYGQARRLSVDCLLELHFLGGLLGMRFGHIHVSGGGPCCWRATMWDLLLAFGRSFSAGQLQNAAFLELVIDREGVQVARHHDLDQGLM